MPLFPKHIDTFVDLFAGGCNVGINANANTIVVNEYYTELVDLYRCFQTMSNDTILRYIKGTIDQYSLSKTNKEGFLKLRDDYNKSKTPLDLYVLSCHSFNFRIRFNKKMEFNEGFGANRSYFNTNLEKRLMIFLFALKSKNIVFTNYNFVDFNLDKLSEDDFVYLDPPYLIADTAYNKLWSEEQEIELLERLDWLNKKGIKFALSNVLENKHAKNEILIEWSKKFKTYKLKHNYDKLRRKDSNKGTDEVLVTNY